MFKTLARAATLTAAVALSGCATTGSTRHASSPTEYCRAHPEICILIGAAVVGGVVLVAAGHDNDSSPPPPSDARLKTDLHYLQTLPSGVKLYSYRYRGSDQVFVGALAQDLLADPRFRGSVTQLPSGFYAVDYGALGLNIIGAEAMQRAASKAIALAS